MYIMCVMCPVPITHTHTQSVPIHSFGFALQNGGHKVEHSAEFWSGHRLNERCVLCVHIAALRRAMINARGSTETC